MAKVCDSNDLIIVHLTEVSVSDWVNIIVDFLGVHGGWHILIILRVSDFMTIINATIVPENHLSSYYESFSVLEKL
jgi:hypothetical protein